MVNTKVKKGLRSSIIIEDLDVHCSRSYCPSYIIILKVYIQGFNTKKFLVKEFKLKKFNLVNKKPLAFSHSNFNKPAKLFC